MELKTMSSVSNPLLLPEVLEKILHYVNLEDLLSCRTVSKVWNKEATTLLKHRLENEVSILFAAHPTNKLLPAIRYLRHFQKSTLILKNVVFKDFLMDTVKHHFINRLWTNIGHNLSSLKLNYGAGSKAITSKQLSDILVNRSPFLTELNIVDLPDIIIRSPIFEEKLKENGNVKLELQKLYLKIPEPGDVAVAWGRPRRYHIIRRYRSYTIEFLEDLFSAAPNLQSLFLDSNYDSEGENCKILRCLTNKGHLTHLTELSIDMINGDGMAQLVNGLEKCHLISVDLKCIKENGDVYLNTFMNSHADTLESLTIILSNWSQENTIIFPVSKNLKNLTFGRKQRTDINIPNGYIPFDNFDYGRQFPKLETLKICDTVRNGFYLGDEGRGGRTLNLDTVFSPISTPCLTVKNLHLPGMISESVLDRIANIFPNVLKLSLDAQHWIVLHRIWSNWPLIRTLAICLNMNKLRKRKRNLNNFEIEQTRSLDSILTGITDESLKKHIKEHGLNTIPEEKLRDYQTEASIVDLKNLTHLMFHDGPTFDVYGNWFPFWHITDFSCVFGFAQMKSLTRLWIDDGIHKITPSTRSALEDKIGTKMKIALGNFNELPSY